MQNVVNSEKVPALLLEPPWAFSSLVQEKHFLVRVLSPFYIASSSEGIIKKLETAVDYRTS